EDDAKISEFLGSIVGGFSGSYAASKFSLNDIHVKTNTNTKTSSFIDGMSETDAKRYNQWQNYVDEGIESNDRVKLMNWEFSPDPKLYKQHKLTYDNPSYYNQMTGEVIYPGTKASAKGPINGSVHIDGFLNGKYEIQTLEPGAVIDRYGSNGSGKYFSPIGTEIDARALPPHMYDSNILYTKYVVLKPLPVKSGVVAPWFDKTGNGIQYFTKLSVDDLIAHDYIKIIP
ncbi:TNT domain-containing protein, partial [Streptococcus marimammalium]|uniref:TNT domain-containing protein n=1 Tax=Streptococcus marimammalium TaxID=269666 RepID=UPI0003771185